MKKVTAILWLATMTLGIPYIAQAQDSKFVKVIGHVYSASDSAVVNSAKVFYEKLPYYDDMGISETTNDMGFEFYLLAGTEYNFRISHEAFEEIKILQTIRPEDSTFEFDIYLEPKEELSLITLNNLIFGRSSDRITESSFSELDQLVDWLESRPNIIIQLEGHTDFAGNADANMRLSQARVEAVKEYLVKKGVKKSRILTKAFGGSEPLTLERTSEAQAKNRRVEVRVIRQ